MFIYTAGDVVSLFFILGLVAVLAVLKIIELLKK